MQKPGFLIVLSFNKCSIFCIGCTYLSVNRTNVIEENSNFSSQLRAELYCASPIPYHVFLNCDTTVKNDTFQSSFFCVFLSHLLIAGCDIGVQISVRPFVRPFVRQHLRRSLVFSTSEIAASLKPCIVIVPDIPFKHAP